jgi:tRNA dimethylallyltransferase
LSKVYSSTRDIIVPVLLGPTAVGKTAYALELAQKNGWEILSCDSRQIYREMNIGTAKPHLHELKSVKHWLIDIKNPDELYSAVEFAHDALEIIRMRASQGVTTLICGGTGLYFKVLSEGISPGIETDPAIKAELMHRGIEQGSETLFAELSRVDPDASKKIHVHDLQRLVRALAVYYQTGVPFSKSQTRGTPPEGIIFRTIKLTADRSMLYDRIDKRVHMMIEDGLVDECRHLLDRGYKPDSPGLQCVGYRELIPCIDSTVGLITAIANIQQNTRRYAKRQCTWFAHQTSGVEYESGVTIENLQRYYALC